MTSGLKMSATSSRTLKFHDESESALVEERYCAVWNPDINGIGAWDTNGVKSIYTDDTVTSCFATKLGTFAVVAKIHETPYVQVPILKSPLRTKSFNFSTMGRISSQSSNKSFLH
jgi:hypothetical protein